MPEPSGRDLLHEWQQLMESLVSTATSVAGRADVPARLTDAMQRQLDLVREVVEREQRLQREITSHVMAPVDGLFDLLEQSGATMRRQAEALAAAGRALEESGTLMRQQAELFEKTVRTFRRPAELAKTAAGVERRKRTPPGSSA